MRTLVTSILIALALALTAAPPAGAGGSAWRCVRRDDGSKNPGGGCGPLRYRQISGSDGHNTYVINDMWNPPGAGHPQTIDVDNPGDWQVTSDQAAGNTAVLSYPDVQQVLTTTHDAPAPLERFRSITGTFTQSMPDGGDNEAAYDIWLGANEATNYDQEVMIWVDDHRTNPPPGHVIARRRFAGVRYAVWRDPRDGNPGFRTIYFVRERRASAGRVDIGAMLDWLVRRKLTDATGLNQLDFGWEICSTGGRPETFTISRYALRLRCRGGGSRCYGS